MEFIVQKLEVHVLFLKVDNFPVKLLDDYFVSFFRAWKHVELDDWPHSVVLHDQAFVSNF